MKTLIATTAALLTLPALLAAAPAQAAGDDVRRSGSCSGASDWKIKAGPDNGRIEVEAEIDSNRAGQAWRWTLRHDGRVTDTGRATTQGPSGSFSVHRRTGNAPGTDSFRFTARNPASGERCVARVSL